MKILKRLVLALDRWQRRNRVTAMTYAVIKKFGEDEANLLVVALGWYGFTAIYPLLLVVVTILGFIGAGGLGTGVVNTLHQFPIIGSDFNAGSGASNLHGSVPGLIIGVAGLLYGAQGVTQTAQQAMAQVWNVPRVQLPGFLARLGRSVSGLAIIGGTFFLNAFLGSIAAGYGLLVAARIGLIAVLLIVNIGCYFAAFMTLTPPKTTEPRQLLPGAMVGAVGFTLLTTIGTGLVQHQLRHTQATYGAFASIIGVVFYLLLLAKLTVYAAEFNTVRVLGLWPRALPTAEPTDADTRVAGQLARQEHLPPERNGVGFEPNPVEEAPRDARTWRPSESERPSGSKGGVERTDWSMPPSHGSSHRRR